QAGQAPPRARLPRAPRIRRARDHRARHPNRGPARFEVLSVDVLTPHRRSPIIPGPPQCRPFLHRIPAREVFMSAVSLFINGKRRTVDADPAMPLLWVLRDVVGLTGTKFGCGIAQCGACTVHLDGAPVRSCSVPLSAAAGKRVTTIEGLSPHRSHALQQAWIELDVPQCGYCQSGQLMSAA